MAIKHSIRFRLVLTAMAFLIGGQILTVVMLTSFSEQDFRALVDSRSRAIANSLRFRLERLLALRLDLHDIAGFGSQCKEVVNQYPDISDIRVFDRSGVVLAAVEDRSVGTKIDFPEELKKLTGRAPAFSLTDKDGIHVTVPLYSSIQLLIGGIRVDVDMRMFAARQAKALGRSILISSLLALALGAFFLAALYLWVTRPISALVDAIDRVSKGLSPGLSKKLLASKNEVGQAAFAFNTLVNDLSSSRAELDRYTMDLERMVENRTAELNRVNETLKHNLRALISSREGEERLRMELEQVHRSEALSTLAGGIAHDLNNILSGFIGYPDLILMELPEDHPVRRHVVAIRKAGERAAALVHDLVVLSGNDLGYQVPVDMTRIFRSTMEGLELSAVHNHYPGLGFDFDVPPELPSILGTPDRLVTMVSGLITHASDATKGMGRIRLKIAEVTVKEPILGLEAIPSGRYLQLSVVNPGAVLPAGQVKHLFEPFFLRKAIGRGLAGSGLGLPMVLGIVHEHHGFVDAKSKKSTGTIIDVYLPVEAASPKQASQVPQVAAAPAVAKQAFRILVVDDLPEQRELAEEMLVALGHHVSTASGGLEAIEYLKVHPVDVLLLDVILEGGISGVETLRKIRAFLPELKVIVSTGWAEPVQFSELRGMNVREFIAKPWGSSAIARAIASVTGTE